ncbi:MAG: ParB/RepB/Spo0J family partition protein [Vicinamibacterales bacterium]|nr:ParB/RepB/Spo0J family partition protein [Vicinamibacterales bacterium]
MAATMMSDAPALGEAIETKRVAIEALRPSPLNPRKRFDAGSMTDLEANIRQHGVIVPLLARRRSDYIEVIDGERRYRAAARVGLSSIPVIFRDELSDGEVIEIQLLSAIQRQDLTPLEEARGYQALLASNPSRYSAAYIADRISRSERYVWDRMKLLELIPPAALALEAEKILVGHAELLAKLKPEDQRRALAPPDHRGRGGLWARTGETLDFGEDPDDCDDVDALDGFNEDAGPDGIDAQLLELARAGWPRLKPVTVKELEAWIAYHVRFDVQHMAQAAPLDFGPVQAVVEAAKAVPGRGKKVVSITQEYRVDDDARDPGGERTFGAQSWHRADGSSDSAPVCEHGVLGVFVAGRGYGTTMQVCIAKDKCQVHWAQEIKAREKSAKLRAQGKGGQAAQREVVDEAARRAEVEAAERKRAAWYAMRDDLTDEAVSQLKGATSITKTQAAKLSTVYEMLVRDAVAALGASSWHQKPAAALLVMGVLSFCERADSFEEFLKDVVVPFGLKPKPFQAIRVKHLPAETPAPAKKKASPAKVASKAAKSAKGASAKKTTRRRVKR